MTRIDRAIAYLCDCCYTAHIYKKEIITISGQLEGLTDGEYEFHFCNNECIELEIEVNKYDDNFYINILKDYMKRKVEK